MFLFALLRSGSSDILDGSVDDLFRPVRMREKKWSLSANQRRSPDRRCIDFYSSSTRERENDTFIVLPVEEHMAIDSEMILGMREDA